MLNYFIIKILEECLVVSAYLLIIELLNWVFHELHVGQVFKTLKLTFIPIHQIKITPYSIMLISVMLIISATLLSWFYHLGLLI